VVGKLLRNTTSGAEEGDVDTGERIGSQLLDDEILSLKGSGFAGRAFTGEQGQFPHGKLAAFQAADHFDAHGSRGADDGDVQLSITHACGLVR